MEYDKEQFVLERRKKKIQEYYSWTHDFGVAVYNISKEFNVGSLLRTSHCAKGKDFYLIGENSYNTYASASGNKWTNVSYFKTIKEFTEHVKKTDYNLIPVEQSNKSVSLFDFQYPKKPLFLFGAEKGGIPEEILGQNYQILEIPQYGLVHSLNLSCSGSIVIYHYLYSEHLRGKGKNN